MTRPSKLIALRGRTLRRLRRERDLADLHRRLAARLRQAAEEKLRAADDHCASLEALAARLQAELDNAGQVAR